MKIKYPRTYHLPWSPGATDDDKTHDLSSIERMFGGQVVVITEKMDGENATIYFNGDSHARSLDSKHHESRSCVKSKAFEFEKQWGLAANMKITEALLSKRYWEHKFKTVWPLDIKE